jgi:hypothetical protein
MGKRAAKAHERMQKKREAFKKRKRQQACPLRFTRRGRGFWDATYVNALFTVGKIGDHWVATRLWPLKTDPSRGEEPTLDEMGPYKSRSEAQRAGACALWRDLYGR